MGSRVAAMFAKASFCSRKVIGSIRTESMYLFFGTWRTRILMERSGLSINGFPGGGNVREGEFLLSQGYWINSYGVDVSVFRNLANKDFNGTVGLIDGFRRREIRISMKLDLASSL